MSFLSRFEQVREAALDQLDPPILAEFVALVCNGCGTVVESRSLEQLIAATEGWTFGNDLGDDDYCPRCRP